MLLSVLDKLGEQHQLSCIIIQASATGVDLGHSKPPPKVEIDRCADKWMEPCVYLFELQWVNRFRTTRDTVYCFSPSTDTISEIMVKRIWSEAT